MRRAQDVRIACKRFLDAGADPNRPNPDGVTPLMVAIDNFAFDTAKLLLSVAPIRICGIGGAAPRCNTAIDMNTYDLDAYTERTGPPIVTTKTTPLELARLFLKAGVNPNTQLNMHRPGRGGNSGRFADEILTTGATPMLRAAASQDSAAVKLLLEYGGRIDVPNVMGATPVMAAVGLGMGRSGRASIPAPMMCRPVDRDARNSAGSRRRHKCADHRRHQQDLALGAWQLCDGAGRAKRVIRRGAMGLAPCGPVSD